MSQARLSRCLRLLDILQSRIGYHAKQLANDLGVSHRTIFRDLRLLRDAGISLTRNSRKSGYIVGCHVRMEPTRLSDEELLALLMAAHVSVLSRAPQIGGLVHRAVRKLLGQASANCREEAANLLNSVVRQPSFIPWPEGKKNICSTIMLALRHKQPLRIVYHPGHKTRGPVRTKITPDHLVVSEATWHLVGRSSWHRRTCKFDIGLIQHAEQIDEIPTVNRGMVVNPSVNPQQSGSFGNVVSGAPSKSHMPLGERRLATGPHRNRKADQLRQNSADADRLSDRTQHGG
jgi:predicted DNA-binding transcriptional regulator YafY